LPDETNPQPRLVGRDGKITQSDMATLSNMLANTVTVLRGMGKRIVLIAPPPREGFDVGRCWARRLEAKPVVGPSECQIDRVAYERNRSELVRFIDRVERSGIVPIVRLDSFLCKETSCATTLRGNVLYHDAGHLASEGSKVLGQMIGLGDLAWRLAL
jgi:hypothetical protein